MSCTLEKNQAAAQVQDQGQDAVTINAAGNIREPSTIPYPIAFGKKALSKDLTKGSYKITGEIQANNSEAFTVFDRELKIPQDDGSIKRIFIHRLHVSPAEITAETEAGPVSGAKFNMTFTVIDNPLPVAGIVYGLGAIGTLVSGYFFVDRIDKFTSSTTGQLVSITLAGLGAFLAYKTYK